MAKICRSSVNCKKTTQRGLECQSVLNLSFDSHLMQPAPGGAIAGVFESVAFRKLRLELTKRSLCQKLKGFIRPSRYIIPSSRGSRTTERL